MDAVLTISLKLLAVLALVALNGFFVSAEFAIVKVRATQIQTLIAGGSRRARMAEHLLKHLDAYLSASQLGITMASLGLGWIGEPFVAELLNKPLALAGITTPAAVHAISFIVGFAIITFLHITLGEQAPKMLAIRKPRESALFVAYPLVMFYRLMYPFIWVLNHTSNWMVRQAGVDPASEAELAHSEEELRLVLAHGEVSDLGRSVSLRALDLHKRTARQVMRARTQVVYLSTQRSLADNLALAKKSGHTRFPLCEGSLDNVVGVVHMKDLLWLLREKGDAADLREVKREPLFVPETMPLEKLLNMFRTHRRHLAVLMDEFGGTVGIVTLEDIVEELVGEIHDEFDIEKTKMIRLADFEYCVEGMLPLHELQQRIGAKFEAENVATVGGYVVDRAGYVPKEGERVDLGEWDCTVLKTDGRRVQQVLLKRKPVS
jgi:CBS domain containing-hemolysin-like protein